MIDTFNTTESTSGLILFLFLSFVAIIFSFFLKSTNDWELFWEIKILKNLKKPFKFVILYSNGEQGIEGYEGIKEVFNVEKFYEIGDELDKLGYKGFNMEKLNRAHRNICEKILNGNEKCVALVQNMKNPRDFYDIICYNLMNNIEYNVIFKIFTRDGVKFSKMDYTVENILADGGQMRYGKKNRREDVNIIKNGNIYVDREELMEFVGRVRNDYFTVNVYKGESGKIGVEVLENNLNMDNKELWYIGQYLVMV